MAERFRALPLVVLLVAAPSIWADSAQGDHRYALARYALAPNFETLDCTNEGYVDSGEVDEHFPAIFNRHDKNLDRRLSRSEYLASRDDAAALEVEAALFGLLDRDGNDSVTPLEYRDGMIALIRSLDIDGDGEITRAEMDAPLTQR